MIRFILRPPSFGSTPKREVPELAAAIARAREDGGRIHLDVPPGLEVALGGMLRAGGYGQSPAPSAASVPVSPLDLVVSGDPAALPVRLYRALQLLAASRAGRGIADCVSFDLETTDNAVDACGIIEIGAARIRDGQVVATFSSPGAAGSLHHCRGDLRPRLH